MLVANSIFILGGCKDVIIASRKRQSGFINKLWMFGVKGSTEYHQKKNYPDVRRGKADETN